MLEFGFFIILNDVSEQDKVKAFVKEYYSCFDCIDENVDSSSDSKSVCAECLGIDGDDLDFVCDSLFTGNFAKSLAVQGFNIKSLRMSIEEIGIASGIFEDGLLEYRAISCDDEDEPAIRLTGSGNKGFVLEELPYSTDLYGEIDNLSFHISEVIPLDDVHSSTEEKKSNIKDFVIEKERLIQYKGKDAEVMIPDGITAIGTHAFYRNRKIKKVLIPEGVTKIEECAFGNCTKLSDVTIPDSVRIIETGAFSECDSLKSIVIPDGVTDIGEEAFCGCSDLEDISIPDSVICIGTGTFDDTAWLDNQTGALVYAGKVVYDYIEDMPDDTSIILDSETKGIAEYAFIKKSNLTSITLPNGLVHIGSNAFTGCSGLTGIIIPDSVTSIGDYAFDGCKNLNDITIPDSVTNIGKKAFYDTQWYNNQPDGLVYAGKVMCGYKGNMPDNYSVSLADGTKGLAVYAFNGCDNLKSIIIPESVKSINEWAISYCSGLTDVSLPNGLVRIESFAFEKCTNLKNIVIPEAVTYIGYYAFSECTNMTSIHLPESVVFIGDSAFKDCPNLTVHAPAGSYAEQYCKENGIPFETE